MPIVPLVHVVPEGFGGTAEVATGEKHQGTMDSRTADEFSSSPRIHCEAFVDRSNDRLVGGNARPEDRPESRDIADLLAAANKATTTECPALIGFDGGDLRIDQHGNRIGDVEGVHQVCRMRCNVLIRVAQAEVNEFQDKLVRRACESAH